VGAERRPAEPVQDGGGAERGDGGADVPHPVHADGEALPLAPVPAGDERDADRERRACDPEDEADSDERPVALGEPERDGRRRGEEQDRREHDPPAEAVGQHADRDPEERAEDDGDRDQDGRLGAREV
jgi:hypothetical protein